MRNSVEIHPTAIVAESAVLGDGCCVGAYSIIGPKVVMGVNNNVMAHVVIEGNTQIADGNTFFQFCSVGAAPQDLKFRGEESLLRIGSGNIVREFVTLQPGTASGGMLTEIGNNNLFMASSHVGHDSKVGNNCWFANSVALAGHVTVGCDVIVGGLSGIHQFVHLGDHCMIGAGSMVAKDVLPYCNAQGDRAGLVGINKIGLQRRGFTVEEVQDIDRAYRSLFYGEGVFTDRLRQLKERSASDKIMFLVNFAENSERGICFPRKKNNDQD
jgi:UDP-N-acetylglucosamine acyltransferase